MRRKIIGIAVMAAMMVLMIPSFAFATGTDYFEVTIGDETKTYETAVDAVASVGNDQTAVIKLLDDYSGGGVKVDGTGKNITFDLNGYNWEIGTPLVGSTGTETNAFQLLMNNAVTFMNGAVSSDVALILIQNYCELTLDNVDLSLDTPGTGRYAVSNNNGRTILKNGTTVTVLDGNIAMDSFNFGSTYTGGDVIIEDAVISGDVEVANGGKMALNGGTIDGNVNVYNYKYDSNVKNQSEFTMTSGLITGDLMTSEVGKTAVSGGEVQGSVTLDTSKVAAAGSEHEAEVTISSGVFGNVDANVNITATEAARITTGDVTKTVIGLANINEAIKNAPEGTTVEFIKAAENAEVEAPAGVTVENNAGVEISVNGEPLAAGATVEVTAPETPPADQPSDKPQQGEPADGKAPETGDHMNLGLLAGIMLTAAAAGAAAIVLRRKGSRA